MFNSRQTVVPKIEWFEAEENQFFMRTPDDHARVYLCIGGDAAGHWRAIINDRGLTTGTECNGSAYSSEYLAKKAVQAAFEYDVHKRVTKARAVMTFYTTGKTQKTAVQEFAAALKHKWEHHGMEAMNKMLGKAAKGS